MTSTVPVPRTAHRSAAPAPAPVVVISARGDTRGAEAAEACAALVRAAHPAAAPVVATHAAAPDLAAHIASARQLYVLDPGRVRAWRERRRARAGGAHRALAAPAAAADRLELLRVLREHQARTRWIGDPQQLRAISCAA